MKRGSNAQDDKEGKILLCTGWCYVQREVGVVTVVGDSHRGDSRPAVWPPGEKWGGYVAASRSPSRGADGVAARAATPSGGVDRDNSYDAISSEQESAQFEFCR